MRTAPPDPHIEPITVFAGKRGPFYLHTSPEMGMKKLLSFGVGKIFQLCKVFREEDLQEVHNTEFTMLEWYRGGTYEDTMEEVEELISALALERWVEERERFQKPWRRHDVERLIVERLAINPFPLPREGLLRALRAAGFACVDERDEWTDLFFKVMIEEIEPAIREDAPYFLVDWPSAISTMAKRKEVNKVERFELYIDGLEIANGYTELLDAEEQEARFLADNTARLALGKQEFSIDEDFLEAVSTLAGPVSGVSIGVDRLLMALLKEETIDGVLPLRVRVNSEPSSAVRGRR